MKQISFLQKIYLDHYAPEVPGRYYAPDNLYVRRYFSLLWQQLGKLVILNLVFTVSCIPLFTIPASISALDRALFLLVREGHCDIWDTFWTEFKSKFFKKLTIGAMSLVAILFLLATLYLYKWINAKFFSLVTMPFFLGIIVLLLIYLDYFFALFSMLCMPVKELAKKTVLIAIKEYRCTLKLLIPYVFSALAFMFILYLFPVFLLIFFSATQLFKCVIINNIIDTNIIEGSGE